MAITKVTNSMIVGAYLNVLDYGAVGVGINGGSTIYKVLSNLNQGDVTNP